MTPPTPGGGIDSSRLIDWFDLQAPLYRLWRDDYDGELASAVLAALRAEPSRRVLDAGCGTGLFTIGIARAEPRLRITGVDASAGMLAVARRQARRMGLANLRLQQADVLALPFREGSFDTVVAAGLMPCLNDPPAALAEFRRVLGDRGRLISLEFERTAMGLRTRLFFGTMITGYRIVSRILPRYRFARRWTIAESTIDLARYEGQLAAAGFRLLDSRPVAGHRLYALGKGRGGAE